MAEIAIEFSPCFRHRVRDVQFVLPGVEKRVEIITAREVALRRARRQSYGLALLGAVANRAGLLRTRGEFDDVTFDAGFVAGKFQPQLFVAIRRGDYSAGDFPCAGPVVARIAFQIAREIGVRDFDQPLMCLMREVAVVFWLFRDKHGGRLFIGLLSARGERIEQRQAQSQTAKRKRDFYSLQQNYLGHFRSFNVSVSVQRPAFARGSLIHSVSAAMFASIQSLRRGRICRRSSAACFTV